MRGVELCTGKDLSRLHGGPPSDGNVEESAFRVDQGLRDYGGAEAGEAKGATAIGEGHPVESLEDASEIGGELEEVTESVRDSLADFVEGAAGEIRGREAETACDSAERGGVGEMEEGSAELLVGWNRNNTGGGIGGGV